MDLLWILPATWAFWCLIGRPVHNWFGGFKRLEIRGAHELGTPPADEPKPRRRGRSQIIEMSLHR